MDVGRFHFHRICGGRYHRVNAAWFRRFPGGWASDHLGVLAWVDPEKEK